MGRRVTGGEVFKEVKADEIFYKRSGGGATLSGGEPLSQPKFAASLFQLCREAGIHTVVDTCGYAPWSTVKQVLQYADLVLYDFKHMDPFEHKKYTGVSNDLILANVKKIYHELSNPLLARVPVITGFNDSAANIEATAMFITDELDNSIRVHLLPYHRLGETKFERLEKKNKIVSLEPPGEEHLSKLKQIVLSFGPEIFLGG